MCTWSSGPVSRTSATAAGAACCYCAVHGPPGVADRAGPHMLLGSDGHAHAAGDGRAHPAAALQSPFEFQLLQRLAQRGAGDAEPGREVAFVGRISPTENSESNASVSTVLRCQYFGSGTVSSCVVPTLSSAIAVARRRFDQLVH